MLILNCDFFDFCDFFDEISESGRLGWNRTMGVDLGIFIAFCSGLSIHAEETPKQKPLTELRSF